ncbi:hypothetical protein QTN47_04815 [Danxiaibacter flavus]|uniref:CARDB domain-containing protein n=1 Tax=Danxiaibacter flavus TaxID=3049108 RepID=A0ABV3ZAD3_9BACT|nr:hypothetical protein QNM32_04815 [Chitinophagaceae bacterium DXS]
MKDSRTSSSNGNKRKPSDKKWFTGIDPNGVMNNAQRILNTAVEVLEEEIAAGILAAKKIEKKVIDVDEVRSGNAEELMSRIRRDTHDAVDIFLDALSVIANYVNGLSETIEKTKKNGVAKEAPNPVSGYQVPTVKNDLPVKAGESMDITIELSNDNEKPMEVSLRKAALVGPDENKIAAKNIIISPQTFTLKPLSKQKVHIAVKVPVICKPGSYSGLFIDNKNTRICTVVVVDVIK